MPLPRGIYYRVKTYPSGKRVRLAISPGGRILETKVLPPKARNTATKRRLARRRRRIGR